MQQLLQVQNLVPLALLPTTDASTRITLVPATTVARWTANPMSRSAADRDEPVKLKRAPGDYNPVSNWCVCLSFAISLVYRLGGKDPVQTTRLDRAVKKLQVNADVLRRFLFSKVFFVRSCTHTHTRRTTT